MAETKPDMEVKAASHSLLDRAKEEIGKAKEEIGAILHRDHSDSSNHDHLHLHQKPAEHAVKDVFERAKKDLEAIVKHHKPHHHDNIMERAKEEMEAFAVSIHLKEKHHHFSLFRRKNEGCMAHIGSWFEKVCAPWCSKKD